MTEPSFVVSWALGWIVNDLNFLLNLLVFWLICDLNMFQLIRWRPFHHFRQCRFVFLNYDFRWVLLRGINRLIFILCSQWKSFNFYSRWNVLKLNFGRIQNALAYLNFVIFWIIEQFFYMTFPRASHDSLIDQSRFLSLLWDPIWFFFL